MSGTLLSAVVHAPRDGLESVIAVTHSLFFLPSSLLHLMSLTFSASFIPGNEPAASPALIVVHPDLIPRGLSHRCEGCQADK